MLRAVARLVVCLALIASPAAAEDAFTVSGVPVDATAADAIQARTAALAEGQRVAWQRLIERLVAPDQTARFTDLPAAQIDPLVQAFEVAGEKVAPDRYIAELTFHFHPEGVRALLASSQVTFVEGSRAPLVVLPVFQTDTVTILFEDGNPWRLAWDTAAGLPGLVPIVLPLGDLEDLAAIDAPRALAEDAPAIDGIEARYGATGAVIAVARPDTAVADGSKGLAITTTMLLGDRREVRSTTVALPLAEPDEALFAAAARAVRDQLDGAWKAANLASSALQRQVRVEVPVASLADWVDVRRRLQSVDLVRTIAVTTVGARLVSTLLTVAGDDAQLAAALAAQRLALTPDADILVLRRSDSAVAAP